MSTPASVASTANYQVWEDFGKSLRATYGDGIHGYLHGAGFQTAHDYAEDNKDFFQLQELYIQYVTVAKFVLDRETFENPTFGHLEMVSMEFMTRYREAKR